MNTHSCTMVKRQVRRQSLYKWFLEMVSDTVKFGIGDPVVYFSHGVGEITDIETMEAAGIRISLYVIHFVHDKILVKIPVDSPKIRPICSREEIDKALGTIVQRARKSAILWCKKMAIYDEKVNSGSPVALAEVIRDIYKNVRTADYSFTERSVFENAIKRLASELAYVDNVTFEQANERIRGLLESVTA